MAIDPDVQPLLDAINARIDALTTRVTKLETSLPSPTPNPIPVPGTTFLTTTYIDPTAGTNGSGSFASPKNTWAGLSLGGNNAYLQKEGTTWTGTLGLSSGGTGVSTPVCLGTYKAATGARVTDGTSRAKINCNGAVSPGIGINNKAYVLIDSLEVYNNNTNNGIIHTSASPYTQHDITIRYCYVHDNPNTTAGVEMEGEGIMAFGNNMTIDHCVIDNVSGDGIYVEGNNAIISYNTITRVSVPTGKYGDCIQMASSQISTNNCWIHHNNCTNVVDVKQAIILNEGGKGATGGIVEYNICVGPGSGADCWGIEANFPNMMIRGNKISNYRRGIDMQGNASNSTIDGNIITYGGNQSNVRGINVYGASTGLKISNNTLTNTSGLTSTAIGLYNGAVATLTNNTIQGWTS